MRARPFRITQTLRVVTAALFAFSISPVRHIAAAEIQALSETPFVVAERGLHHRLWRKVWLEPTPFGDFVTRTNSYTELASGMHHVAPGTGELLESRAEFELTPDGYAVARHGQQKVIISPVLDDMEGAVDVVTPDGKRLRSTILGINIYNRATGRSLLVAEVSTNAAGWLTAPNEITFSNAFDGFDCEVRYVYNKGDFRQEILPRERIPGDLLAAAGFPASESVLEIWTEFLDAPAPTVRSRVVRREGNAVRRAAMVEPDLIAESLDFGAMKMPSGRAYLAGGRRRDNRQAGIYNRWLHIEGRDFLVESIPLDQAMDLFALAIPPGRSSRALDTRSLYAGRRVPAPARRMKGFESVQGAMTMPAGRPDDGVQLVMDYVNLNANTNNFTFQGDTTYHISGVLTLSGTTTFEGNSVLKFTPSSGPSSSGLIISGNAVVCDTDPYRPVVFTSLHDNTVGEFIASGTPAPDLNNYFLQLYDIDQADIHDMRFSYAYTALTADGGNADVSHVQINHTYYPFYALGGASFRARNALLYDVRSVGVWLEDSACSIEHLTVNKCPQFAYKWQSSLAVTNSIFASVTSWGAAFTSVGNATNASGTGLFQVVGGGQHYLASGSTNRNAGVTNLSSATWNAIQKRTTYPPIVYSNATINTNMVLSPQAQRDIDVPDRGYHYAPLDYAFGGAHLYGNMTVTEGTALGWFHTTSGWQHAGHGIHVGDSKTVSFDGTATAPTYWVRANTVQEYTNAWVGGYGPGGITSWAATLPNFPNVRARFLKCSILAGEGGVNHFRDDWGGLYLRTTDCEFFGGNQGGYGTIAYHTNTLFHRVIVWRDNQDAFPSIVLRNCTMYGGNLSFSHRGGTNWYSQIKDSVFDRTIVNTDGPTSAHALWDYNYNSMQSTNRTRPAGSSDVLWTNYNWKANTFGRFYLPANSILINTGSVNNASLAGLYHFTMQTNQVKETTTRLDLGYHYVAADANGNPIDSDSDGIPDYLEDINGNGSADAGESDWQTADASVPGVLAFPNGLKLLILEPKPASHIP